MSRAFCSDRAGFLYAAGDPANPRTFFQYDILKNAWRPTADLPFDKGENSACAVTQDGWLYVNQGAGGAMTFARLQLN